MSSREINLKSAELLANKTIPKKQFVMVIGSMKKQFDYDVSFASRLNEIYRSDVDCYNNSEYQKSLMLLLRIHFPVSDNGFCEIEHYCYSLNFGKIGEDYESPEQFYERLSDKLLDNLSDNSLEDSGMYAKRDNEIFRS